MSLFNFMFTIQYCIFFVKKKKKEKKIRFWMQELKTYFHSLKETYHP